MRFPKLNSKSFSKSMITDFSGGLNLRDNITDLNDNQLTECMNMWQKNGVFTSRPGIVPINKVSNKTDYPGNCYDTETKIHKDIQVVDPITRVSYTLVTEKSKINSPGIGANNAIFFSWVSDDDIVDFGSYPFDEGSFFAFLKRTTITELSEKKAVDMVYVIGYDETMERSFFVRKRYGDRADKAWENVPQSDIYIPKVYDHCLTDGFSGFSKGIFWEGFNILSNQYKMVYSTVNLDLLPVTNVDASHDMVYKLAKNLYDGGAAYDGTKILVEITRGETTTPHEVTINAGSGEEEGVNVDWIQMKVYGDTIFFYDSDGNIAKVKREDHQENNMVIYAPYISGEEEKNKIYKMKQTKWYGGASQGINGGTRLFLCGNPDFPNLMIWSGLNNPLYFSENAYANVGETTETSPIVNFGVADESLYIFKPNKIYATRYTQGSKPDAQAVELQDIFDAPTSYVFFPLWVVHGAIGCDCPDTIELCRNRLVWAHSNGNIYTLTNNSQYSERNVFTVGKMVERKLKEIDLKHSDSCDYDGHYFLHCRGDFFVLNYNTSGYQYPYSFDKDEDANKKTVWYMWHTDVIPDGRIAEIGNKFRLIGNKGGQFDWLAQFTFNEDATIDITYGSNEAEEAKRFISLVQSKLFDFGMPDRRKTVSKVNIDIGKDGNDPIKITFVSEAGIDETEHTIYDAKTENYAADYIENYAMFPTLQNVLRFGIKLESLGTISLNNISMKYRYTGEAR